MGGMGVGRVEELRVKEVGDGSAWAIIGMG